MFETSSRTVTWLGSGVFYQAPVYPYFLAVIYRVLNDCAATVRLIQAFIGPVRALCSPQRAYRSSAVAGQLLAFVSPFYPSAIFLDSLIEKSSLVTFFTAALLASVSVSPASMTARRCLGAGAILGLLALTRENELILAVPILLWIGTGPFPTPCSQLQRA